MEHDIAIAAYVGMDWASATHYAYAFDASGQKLGHRAFVHSGEELTELVAMVEGRMAGTPRDESLG